MTQKAPFKGPFDRKPPKRKNNTRRLLFHFALFTVLAVALLATGFAGRAMLHDIAQDKIIAERGGLLIAEATGRVKTAAEANASTNALRTKISSGLSSKSRAVRNAANEMLLDGASEYDVAAYIVDTLTEAATSRLTGEDAEVVALKEAVITSLQSQRDSLIDDTLAETDRQIGAMSDDDVRRALSSNTRNYVPMYYSPLMLGVGAVFLLIGLFMGYVCFFTNEDFRKKVTDIVEPLDYLLPFFFGVIVFTLYPMVRVFVMAFQERYKLTGEFVGWGIGNFRDVLFGVNAKLPQALGNTFVYVICTVPISTVISILLAYLLNQKIKLRALFQTAYFLPMVTSATAVGLVWKFMFNGDYGIINWLLSLVDVAKVPWLTDAAYSMAVMIIYGVWDSLPFTIILLISGLQNIDEHYYTVAKVDGAKAKRIFFRITVPLLSPTIGLVLIINSISAFKVFNSVIVLFSGTPGPMYNMYTVVYYIYEQINTSLEYGRAAASSLILFAFILIFTLLQLFVQRKWKYD